MAGLLFIIPLAAATSASSAALVTPTSDIDNMVLCYTPDDRTQTCSGIASLRRTGESTYEETSEVFVRGMEGVSVRFVSQVRLQDGMLCGTPTAEEMRAGVILRDNAPVAEDEARQIVSTLTPVFAELKDRETCERYTAGRKNFRARAWATGDNSHVIDRDVRWVSKAAGYRIKGTKKLALKST